MGEHWGGPPTLTPPSLTLLSAKPRQKLRRCHFGVGMVQAAKQGHTMGLCSGFPYQLPPPGCISRTGGSSLHTNADKRPSVCLSSRGHSDLGMHSAKNSPWVGSRTVHFALGGSPCSKPLPHFGQCYHPALGTAGPQGPSLQTTVSKRGTGPCYSRTG